MSFATIFGKRTVPMPRASASWTYCFHGPVVEPGNLRTSVLVHSGAELSWFPRDVLESLGVERRKIWHFRQADGTVLERSTGMVSVYLADIWTVDEVVFGEPRDLVLLGSRSLEGLNLRIDPVTKRLIDAGPAPAAIAAV